MKDTPAGELQVQVTEFNQDDLATNKRSYELKDRLHSSYLTFFEQLADDFGLRLPRNKTEPVSAASASYNYRVLLDKNLDDRMYYGYGDPAAIRVEEAKETWYYIASTSNDASFSFPLVRSRDLQTWEFAGYIFPPGNKPAWAAEGEFNADYWAPEIHQVGQEFRLYFVARDKTTRELCIGMARSRDVAGPYRSETSPILRGNVIDPHLFIKDESETYLLWKEDNNERWPNELVDFLYSNPSLVTTLFERVEDQKTACFLLTIWPWMQHLPPMERFQAEQVLIEAVIERFSGFQARLQQVLEKSQEESVMSKIPAILNFMKTPMYAQRLNQEGNQLIGEKKKIIENDLDWEAHLVEGLWITEHNKRYYLFYAGNDFSTDKYGIGVAIADHFLGPYRKSRQPFLQSSASWVAPGHPSVTTGPDGRPLLFLHAYFPGTAGYKQFRALLALNLIFKEDTVLIDTAAP